HASCPVSGFEGRRARRSARAERRLGEMMKEQPKARGGWPDPYRMIRRRQFITLLGGAAAWPLAARAQQGGRVRRIGWLMPLDENDPVAKANLSAFTQALAGLGWSVGRNVRIDLRWTGDDINRIRSLAQELVGLQPDIIVTGGVATAAVQWE